ncbi:MAG: dTDP-4-dehydrorhamnose 3,5-epimerase family protein [Verrucomicrobiota bacterium]
MNEQPTSLPGVTLLSPPHFNDQRGSFRPVYADRLHQSYQHPWAEMNLSHTQQGVIRGLHFQQPHPQAKLITVVFGTIFDVVVDLRPGPNFGQFETFTLSAKDPNLPSQIYLPPGLAHGLATPHGPPTNAYLVSTPWNPETEQILAWNDPQLNIPWPLSQPTLSPRDQNGTPLANLRP